MRYKNKIFDHQVQLICEKLNLDLAKSLLSYHSLSLILLTNSKQRISYQIIYN